jgi:predicted ATPase
MALIEQTNSATNSETYTLDVLLNRRENNFLIDFKNCAQDFGYEYLAEYHFYKESIALHNFENPSDQIENLYESFTLISSYRNYHSFNISVSLSGSHPIQQIQQIQGNDYARSLNANDNSEPPIFAIVKLRVAERHYDLISGTMNEADCETAANDLPFLKDINARLKIVNLKCKIRLLDKRTWQYSFEFHDLRRYKVIPDINSLSAGQKAIVHLVFEAYGRGDLKGGLVIIDEPEIHLHYQFQSEYLQVIKELNAHHNCQYILVTHSEALISSATINSVRRFSLNADGYTEIRSPKLSTDQKVLIRILDNTRSTYAFFAKKVVLVEGDSDRYFFKAALQVAFPELDQVVAILHVGGKKEFKEWTNLFEAFGLQVYRIADLDYSYELFYSAEARLKLKTEEVVLAFKQLHVDCETLIADEYQNRTFVLKDGDLECYLGINKDLSAVINFCNDKLQLFLADEANPRGVEVRNIIQQLTIV